MCSVKNCPRHFQVSLELVGISIFIYKTFCLATIERSSNAPQRLSIPFVDFSNRLHYCTTRHNKNFISKSDMESSSSFFASWIVRASYAPIRPLILQIWAVVTLKCYLSACTVVSREAVTRWDSR